MTALENNPGTKSGKPVNLEHATWPDRSAIIPPLAFQCFRVIRERERNHLQAGEDFNR
jgi:hypothetical protein